MKGGAELKGEELEHEHARGVEKKVKHDLITVRRSENVFF